MPKPSAGRIVFYKNEAGQVYPAIVSMVNEIVDLANPEKNETELFLTVFDPHLGPRQYISKQQAEDAEEMLKGNWMWPVVPAAPTTTRVDVDMLKLLVDAAVDAKLAHVTDNPEPESQEPESNEPAAAPTAESTDEPK